MLSVLFLFVTGCFGAIWDCPRRTYWDEATIMRTTGAYFACGYEGSLCAGVGTYYYGLHSSWAMKTVTTNSPFRCSNADFGCDPLPGFKKKCMKVGGVRGWRVDNQYIDEYQPEPETKGYDLGSNKYQKYYKSEYGMEKDIKSNDYKPESQEKSNNGPYRLVGTYSEPNKDNNYDSYSAKDGDKYDNDKYKKYYNDEAKDGLNDNNKNYRFSDPIFFPIAADPNTDASTTSEPITPSPDSADGIFADEAPFSTEDEYNDTLIATDIFDEGNGLMNVDDGENTSFEDMLNEYSGVLALVAVIGVVLILLVLLMKICCRCCNRGRGKGQILAEHVEENGIDDI